MINIKEYMTQTCIWEEKAVDSEIVPTGTFKEPVSLPCFIWGSKGLSVSTEGSVTHTFNKTVCILDDRVKAGDRINGLLVDEVVDNAYFDGSIRYRECILKR